MRLLRGKVAPLFAPALLAFVADFMARRLNWEKAAKRDYIREHGSVPYWRDLPAPRSQQLRVGKRLQSRVRARGRQLIAEFRRLDPAARAKRAEEYRRRILELCDDERNALTRAQRKYASTVDAAGRELLADLRRLTREVPITSRARRGRRERGQLRVPAAGGTALPLVELSAIVRNGVLSARWRPYPADHWSLSLTRHTEKGARLIQHARLGKDTIEHEFTGVVWADGPYRLRLLALRNGERVAGAAIDSLDGSPSVAPAQAVMKARPPSASKKRRKRSTVGRPQGGSVPGRPRRVRFWRGR
jgi:hypothetical protein